MTCGRQNNGLRHISFLVFIQNGNLMKLNLIFLVDCNELNSPAGYDEITINI